jgi:hypothetical protein
MRVPVRSALFLTPHPSWIWFGCASHLSLLPRRSALHLASHGEHPALPGRIVLSMDKLNEVDAPPLTAPQARRTFPFEQQSVSFFRA